MSEKEKKCTCGCDEHDCDCNHDHEHDCDCGCDCECDDDIVTLTTDDGKKLKFYFVGTIEYKGKNYSAFEPAEEIEGISEDDFRCVYPRENQHGERHPGYRSGHGHHEEHRRDDGRHSHGLLRAG